MNEWLAQNILYLLTALAGLGLFLVKVGEWKHGMRPSALEARLQGELDVIAHKARNLIVTDLTALIGKLEQRFDKAGEKSSALASYVQGLPTKEDLAGIWKEIGHMRAVLEDVQRSRVDLGERIARIEGHEHSQNTR